MKTLLIFMTVLIAVSTQKLDMVKVSIFYDAASSESQQFISEQLLPSYDVIGPRIMLDLVPYGYTKRIQSPNMNDKPTFKCPNDDCKANIIHACVVSLLGQSTREQLVFIKCLIDKRDINNENLKACAMLSTQSYDKLETCVNGPTGLDLLSNNGFKTTALSPPLKQLPGVAFNGFLNNSERTLTYFTQVVCSYLNNPPAKC